jgi:hypothetical protein
MKSLRARDGFEMCIARGIQMELKRGSEHGHLAYITMTSSRDIFPSSLNTSTLQHKQLPLQPQLQLQQQTQQLQQVTPLSPFTTPPTTNTPLRVADSSRTSNFNPTLAITQLPT